MTDVNHDLVQQRKNELFLKDFPFIRGKYRNLVRTQPDRMRTSVQRIDFAFLNRVIPLPNLVDIFLYAPFYVPFWLGGIKNWGGCLLLDEAGNCITRVAESRQYTRLRFIPYLNSYRQGELVYEALQRTSSSDISRVHFALFYDNAGKMSDVTMYK